MIRRNLPHNPASNPMSSLSGTHHDEADLATEMKSIKHPFEKGIPATPGIDF